MYNSNSSAHYSTYFTLPILLRMLWYGEMYKNDRLLRKKHRIVALLSAFDVNVVSKTINSS